MNAPNPRKNYYYNLNNELIEEKIECCHMLDFLYNTFWGRLIRPIFASRLAATICAWHQNSACSKRNILPFIQKYHINMDEFIEPSDGFKSFNDFFCRQIKNESRVIDKDENTVIAPADSKLLVIQNLSQTSSFFVKNENFNLVKFFDCSLLAQQFEGGTMMIFRLAPPDYHRFHFPIDCTPTKMKVTGSCYESVNPISFKSGVQPLTKNIRHFYLLETEKFDNVAMIPVGAMFVSHIVKTFTPDKKYSKGDEAGYFEFGGSTVVLMFKKDTISLLPNFIQHSEEGFETEVKMGQVVATKIEIKN